VAEKGDNLLVRGVNWIGDAVMTLPALHALKRANPAARISLLVKPWVSPLFEHDPHVDEIIQYENAFGGLMGKVRLAASLRARRFSAAVLFQNAFDAALIAFLAGIPERIGYSRDGRRLLLTKAVPFDRCAQGLHHIDYYMNLLERAGFEVKGRPPWIYLLTDERLEARRRLSDLKRPVIGLNPGATYGSSKRWRPARFAEVAERVVEELNGSVVIFGGPSEEAICREIMASMSDRVAGSRVLPLAGKTGLRELAAMISECDVLLTNDSGPMHIGYAVGTPLVALFGSTSAEATGPAGCGSIVITGNAECSPCFERECRAGKRLCMDHIGVDGVVASVGSLVKSKRAVFFDRDGTLCRDAQYLKRMEDLEIFPGITALSRLKEKGFLLVGVTNQSGIARGLVGEDFVNDVNSLFRGEYGFDGFYYCPHHPDEHCSCRKPEPGLLVRARDDLGIDLKKSFVVGDKEADMLLGAATGATAILVRTGEAASSRYADFVAGDLREAVDIILGTSPEEERKGISDEQSRKAVR